MEDRQFCYLTNIETRKVKAIVHRDFQISHVLTSKIAVSKHKNNNTGKMTQD